MADETMKQDTLEIAKSLGIADKFEGWDGEFIGVYLPPVGGGTDVGTIVQRMAERREQRDHYTLDLGHGSFPLAHGQARQLIAKLEEARIPYEQRSLRDTEDSWVELNIQALELGACLERERILGGYRVWAEPMLTEGVTTVHLDSPDRSIVAEGPSIAAATAKVLKMLKARRRP